MDDERRTPPWRPAGDMHVYGWRWGADESRRPGLPWIGVFLLVFGGLLLVEQLLPEGRSFSAAIVLALGLALLIKWAVDRGTGSLYAGAILTALAAPNLVEAAGFHADGLTTFSLGVAFLSIAVVRAATGGGLGWQAWLGGLLAIVGGASITVPTVGSLLLPVLLVVVGIALIIRSSTVRPR